MLYDSYKNYLKLANQIKDWDKMSKTEIANKYCDANDCKNKILKDCYFSALVLKYWYMIEFLYKTNLNLGLELEDYYDWVVESLIIGLSYQRWRDKTFEISKDKDGAEKVFNRCIYSTRQRYYKYINQYKRKDNHSLKSLEEIIATDETDNQVCLLDMLRDSDRDAIETFECRELVNTLFKKGETLKAILVDMICFKDCFTQKREISDSIEFSTKKLMKNIRLLYESNNIEYYIYTYDGANANAIKKCLYSLQNASKKKLSKDISNAIWGLKFDKEICKYAN